MTRPIKPDSSYTWLEPQEAPECLEWANKESILTASKLDPLPHTQYVQKRLRELISVTIRCPEHWIAGKLFRLRKDKLNQQGVLEIADNGPGGAQGDWDPVVDIDELGRQEDRNFEFSPLGFEGRVLGLDASRILLLLSNGGSDLVELREFDVRQRRLVPGGFRTGLGRITVAWMDQDHILINHALNGGPTTEAGWPAASYIWRRGTDLQDATLVYTAPANDAICLVGALGPSNYGRALVMRALDYSTMAEVVISLDGTVEEVDLPSKRPLVIAPKVVAGNIVTQLKEPTIFQSQPLPAGSLVAYNISPDVPEPHKQSVVYVPEPDEFTPFIALDGFETSQGRVHLTSSKNGVERRLSLEYHEKAWRLVQNVPCSVGGHFGIVSGDCLSDDVIVTRSGLLQPTAVQLARPDGTMQEIFSQKPLVDAERFDIERLTVSSKDGTLIDYVVLSSKFSKGKASPRPLLITGYGAFGITISTSYFSQVFGGIALVPWLESGGSLAIAFIRGGGDRGEAWHEAARQEKRQKSYDDFIAVAEKLVEDGMTTPKKLGVFGTSNGGLLAAVMGTQRPDLFGAVVSDVPLTDMLRFPLMGMGAAWKHEYGDPEDPKMARILRSYSPFHNIHEGVKYPAFLVTISTKDDRVGAGHARKLVARLKDVGSEHAFLFEDSDGGHGVSDPYKRAALMSRRMGFFLNYLQ